MPLLQAAGRSQLLRFVLRLSVQQFLLLCLLPNSTRCINETSDDLTTSTGASKGLRLTNTTTLTSLSATSVTSSSLTSSSLTSSSLTSSSQSGTTSTSTDTSTSTTSSTFNGTTTWTSVSDTNTTTKSSSTGTSRTSSSTKSSTMTTTCTTSSSTTSISKTSTTTTPPPAIITGGLRLSVTSPDEFFVDPNVPLALQIALTYLGKVDAKSRYSRVVSWRRDSGRKLQMSKSEATLWLHYSFTIPADAAPPVSRAWVAAALAYGTTTELESEVNRAVAERCGQGMYVLTLLEQEGPLVDGVQAQTTTAPPSNASSNPSNVANAATPMRAWYSGLAAMVALTVLTVS